MIQAYLRRRHRLQQPSGEGTDGSQGLRGIINHKRDRLLESLSGDIIDSRIQVNRLMSRRPKVVQPEHPADEIRTHMEHTGAHHLLVCNNNQLIGIISDRDLARSNATYAFDLMTRNPVAVPPDTSLVSAVTTMIDRRISCLPVVRNGELLGVLTRTDLLIAFQCMLHIMSKLLNDQRAATTR